MNSPGADVLRRDLLRVWTKLNRLCAGARVLSNLLSKPFQRLECMANRKTIAVLGGGSAGLTAARTAHQLGARVLFFMGNHADHASLCINAGCMPSKAMFEPIDATHRAKRHGWLEIQPRDPERYLAQIVAWKNRE